jgi:predicted GIY-YIG superfamily endonuclease
VNYILYKATSPSGRTYIGITNNFKRRMKEHGSSKWPFGHALRKYGKENFQYEFEYFDSVEEALEREKELVTPEALLSRKFYNACVGGALSNVLIYNNPMHNLETVENHPNLWTTENNPMNNPQSKQKMIESQNRKRISIDGIEYDGVREASRQIGSYRQFVVHRLRSSNYPTWYYI